MNTECQDIEAQLADMAADRLNASELERVQAHVASCPDCRKSLQQLTDLRSDLRSLPTPAPSPWFADNVAYQVRHRLEQDYEPSHHAWPWTVPLLSLTSIACVGLVVWITTEFGFMTTPPRSTGQFIDVETEFKGTMTLRNLHRGDYEMAGPVANMKVLQKVIPPYPRWADEQHISSYVRVYFLTNDRGTVNPHVRVVRTSGFPELDQNAVLAIRQWQFSPATFITTAWGIVTFQFPPSS